MTSLLLFIIYYLLLYITNKYYCDTFGYESEIEGHKCYVVNQKTNSWVFGQKYYEYPLVCIWVFNGKKYLYTLYSLVMGLSQMTSNNVDETTMEKIIMSEKE